MRNKHIEKQVYDDVWHYTNKKVEYSIVEQTENQLDYPPLSLAYNRILDRSPFFRMKDQIRNHFRNQRI